MSVLSALSCASLQHAGKGLFFLGLLVAAPVFAAEPARLANQSLLLAADHAGDTIVAVGERGHILRSTQGTTWEQILPPTDATLTDVTFVDEKHGWAVGHNAVILATKDGGASWIKQFDTAQLASDDTAHNAPLLSISCISITNCTAAGAYGLLLSTVDGGLVWERKYAKESDSNFYAVHMFDAENWLVAGESGTVLLGSAAGSEWTALITPYDGSFFGFLDVPGDVWLLFGLRGNILRSTDKGQSWASIPSGVDTGLMGGRLLKDGHIAIAGAGGVVLDSQDRGESFTLMRQSKRQAFSTLIDIVPSGNLLLLGEKGILQMEMSHAP